MKVRVLKLTRYFVFEIIEENISTLMNRKTD